MEEIVRVWAVIVNGVCQNVILADDAFIDAQPGLYVDLSAWGDAPGRPGPGWLWDAKNETFSHPNEE